MARRSLSAALLVFGTLGTLGALALTATGCASKAAEGSRAGAANATPTTTPATNELASAAATAPAGEQRIDTSPRAPTPADRIAVTNAPLNTNFRGAKPRKPGSDENLPKWVPLRGRLTVVEAPDLAENLGLVPKGATKTAEGRISVAELMANGNGNAAPASNTTSGTSATWLASNGRVRHGRGR